MYCIITEKKCKKKAYRSHVYRKIEWEPYTGILAGSGYWHEEDEIIREPRGKWNITLNESSRIAGKVVKKQWHITTIRYWDIVGGYHSESIWCGIEKAFPETKTNGELYQDLEKLIRNKLDPIIEQVTGEYEKSEERKIKTANDKLKKAKADELEAEQKYQESKAANDGVFGAGFYDSHYNKDGTSKHCSAEAKEWDKNHKNQERKSSYNTGSFNFDFMKPSFSDTEKSMAEELITAGYKQLSKRYHPDVGGTKEQFQDLGNLKDKILKLI